ncbi:endolytic transglycosylase MltG [Patescibacteria group bacterium]|nr:endolytic transglycosylase MltG [Patescibacteria group bacterium]
MVEDFNLKNQTAKTQKPVKSRWPIFFIYIFISVFVLLFLAIGATAYVYYEIFWPADKSNSQQASFSVEKGSGVKEIAAQLRAQNFIRSQFWFKAYIWYKKQGAILQAGKYSLSPALNIPQILQIITGGKVIKDEVQVTFPEGFTQEQIKQRLVESGIESADFFDDEKVDGFQIQYKFLKEISSQAALEGFLFPDTYRFKKDVKKEEIIKKFLENFDKKLTPAWRAEIERQGKDIYQIVIMASIVQQEALNEEEMPMLAGIFWNRLGRGMLLQSDATVNYATGKKARQASLEDLKIQSPYNTYLYTGLPPAPICNPGEAAIKAAIYFEQSDYLYFLHPLNSPAVYAKTLEEHNRNKAKYLK